MLALIRVPSPSTMYGFSYNTSPFANCPPFWQQYFKLTPMCCCLNLTLHILYPQTPPKLGPELGSRPGRHPRCFQSLSSQLPTRQGRISALGSHVYCRSCLDLRNASDEQLGRTLFGAGAGTSASIEAELTSSFQARPPPCSLLSASLGCSLCKDAQVYLPITNQPWTQALCVTARTYTKPDASFWWCSRRQAAWKYAVTRDHQVKLFEVEAFCCHLS